MHSSQYRQREVLYKGNYHFLQLHDCGIRLDEIPPGRKAAMKVEYKAEEPGDFWRTITIYGNIPEKSFTLDFWGYCQEVRDKNIVKI